MFNHIKRVSHFSTQLLELNVYGHLFWINHDINRTRESSNVLSDRGSHPSFNTIADDRCSHRPPNSDPNPRRRLGPGLRSFIFYCLRTVIRDLRTQKIKSGQYFRKMTLPGPVHHLELGMFS